MGLKELEFKEIYDSDRDDIINDFYIPVLSNSISYRRISGFFSSTSLAVAARGVSRFVLNGGTMKLICSGKLSKADVNMINKAEKEPETIIEKNIINDLNNMHDEFIKDHVYALGWMIAKKKLKIKIAIIVGSDGLPVPHGILHPKIGIFDDEDGNTICFSGSNNETASGWLHNVEEFKVFPSWKNSLKGYYEPTIEKFDELWDNTGYRVKVINVPEAVKNKLIEISKDFGYEDLKRLDVGISKNGIILRDYQKEAVRNWLQQGCKGIFEMATGTGKTYTSLGCALEIKKKSGKHVILITCPYQHLVTQWKKAVEKFNLESDILIIADSNHPEWKDNLADSLRNLSIGHIQSIVIITTHNTFSSANFQKILLNGEKFFKVFLIADEVHGLGSPVRNKGLSPLYDYRLGLSATPKRWLDETGTNILYDYFKGVAFEFSLKKAISKKFLTPFSYNPIFIELSEQELKDYHKKSIAIARKSSKNNIEEDKKALEKLLIQRANIVKNSINKYDALRDLIEGYNKKLTFTLVYTTDQQIDRVVSIINDYDIDSHRFTMNESLSKREEIIKNFEDGEYEAIVAIKCLDEGVDIPAAKTAILMASSGNSREYIQRIGRIIRKHPNKKSAVIRDIIVKPSMKKLPPHLKNLEKKIFLKELHRYEMIAKMAINDSEALDLIYDIKRSIRGG